MVLQVQPLHDGWVWHGSLQPHPLCLQQCHDGTDEPDAAGWLWLWWLPNPLRSWVQFSGSWLGKTAARAGSRRIRPATALRRGIPPEQPSTQVSKLPRVSSLLHCFVFQNGASTASVVQLAGIVMWPRHYNHCTCQTYFIQHIYTWYKTYTTACLVLYVETYIQCVYVCKRSYGNCVVLYYTT